MEAATVDAPSAGVSAPDSTPQDSGSQEPSFSGNEFGDHTQTIYDMVMGNTPDTPTETPKPEQKPVEEAKEAENADTPKQEVPDEMVQLSRKELMELLEIQAAQKLGQAPQETPQDANQQQAQTQEKQAAPQTPQPGVPEWMPQPHSIEVNLPAQWVDAMGGEAEVMNEMFGQVVNTPIAYAADYTNRAVMAMHQNIMSGIETMLNARLAMNDVVGNVLTQRPEYRQNTAFVHEAVRSILQETPDVTRWELPEKVLAKLDASAKRAQQIVTSGKLDATPKGQFAPKNTGARQPNDTRNATQQLSAEEEMLKALGHPDFNN